MLTLWLSAFFVKAIPPESPGQTPLLSVKGLTCVHLCSYFSAVRCSCVGLSQENHWGLHLPTPVICTRHACWRAFTSAGAHVSACLLLAGFISRWRGDPGFSVRLFITNLPLHSKTQYVHFFFRKASFSLLYNENRAFLNSGHTGFCHVRTEIVTPLYSFPAIFCDTCVVHNVYSQNLTDFIAMQINQGLYVHILRKCMLNLLVYAATSTVINTGGSIHKGVDVCMHRHSTCSGYCLFLKLELLVCIQMYIVPIVRYLVAWTCLPYLNCYVYMCLNGRAKPSCAFTVCTSVFIPIVCMYVCVKRCLSTVKRQCFWAFNFFWK